MYAYWVCAARETPPPPHFQPWISVPDHIIFTNFQKKSVPEHHHFTFLGGFCRSGDHHFKNFFNFNPFIASHGRLSLRRGIATRVLAVPETPIFTLKTDQARSRALHFHARPEARSLCHGTYLPIFGVSTPPPPGGGALPLPFVLLISLISLSCLHMSFSLLCFPLSLFSFFFCPFLFSSFLSSTFSYFPFSWWTGREVLDKV